jgi:hypothetical protein
VHQQAAGAEQKAGAEEERMAQPTGPNYRFCHYAKGDKSERLPLWATASPWKRNDPCGPPDLDVDDLRQTSFACETFSGEKVSQANEVCRKSSVRSAHPRIDGVWIWITRQPLIVRPAARRFITAGRYWLPHLFRSLSGEYFQQGQPK